jgi:hypothetical protein
MTSVSVAFEWRPVDNVRLESGRPAFATLDDLPGVYRFDFEWPNRASGVYIGETDRLRRRAQHYRTPGAGQPTNLRMNQELVSALSAGVRVAFAIVTAATIELDGGAAVALDLARKTGRLIVENAAIAAVIAERDADPLAGPILMNRAGVGEDEWK